MAIGFRILPVEQRIDAELVSRFAALPVANVSDAMSRMTSGGASLRPMHAGGVLAGPAVTVKARPGDNLMLHKALDIAEPGDVVVVDASGDLTNALIGELMTAYAESRGIAGIVIWGAIRDAATIRANAFPVFAAGVTHRGPYKDGPGEVNVPIAIEGMVIRPGDLLLGDDDGLVCVPIADAEQVLKTASAKHTAETAQMEKIRRGENPRAWVDETLKRLGCEGL
ncbi:RraA family protein [uncultured Sphingomonas sp.]|uniref:RraA family protein n=1 Tax=uncultured Sphingomonas sp. TaxID=158754 RepID=UPI0025E73E6A|nr:RraA family protein [uncultured Sphingomonas sp.]